jgi:beta-xylosidase
MINNPILRADFPDPDVIRVEDTYYMVSTTMHFMPGAVILRSFDLIHWEIYTHVYDTLDDTPMQKLNGDQSIYGQGMWAASLRHHRGRFYVCFVANDTRKTYLYQANDISGPWKKQTIEGFYHDCSLLFDDDDRVYIVYGNTEIYLTELNEYLTGPKLGGLHRWIVRDREGVRLGYEGTHFYKINQRYYLFFILWLSDGSGRRVEACFSADSLEEEFTGKDVLDDDMGFFNMGVAQGGIVDTPDGDWYAISQSLG